MLNLKLTQYIKQSKYNIL